MTQSVLPASLLRTPVAPSRPLQVEILGGDRLPFSWNSLLYWFQFLLLFKKSRTMGNLATGQQDCLQLIAPCTEGQGLAPALLSVP